MKSVVRLMQKDFLSGSACYRIVSVLCYLLALLILTKGMLKIATFDIGEIKLFFSVLFISCMFMQLILVGLALEILRCLKAKQ